MLKNREEDGKDFGPTRVQRELADTTEGQSRNPGLSVGFLFVLFISKVEQTYIEENRGVRNK